jgi:transcriptional regulator with XRE-family HTH domain
LSITHLAERTGMDRAIISRLENGLFDNPTIATMTGDAKALGKKVLVSLVEAAWE